MGYKEWDMLVYHEVKVDNPEITVELDHLIGNMKKEMGRFDFSDFADYGEETNIRHARARTDPSALEGIKEDRNVAVNDESVVKLPAYWASELAPEFESIIKAFTLNGGEECKFTMTGKFWYPKGGYMGWHTNNTFPGYRMYLSRLWRDGWSFFRYKHPTDGQIITSKDSTAWTARIFRIDPARPLWHCVYSEGNRFSFGCNLFVKSGPTVKDNSYVKNG